MAALFISYARQDEDAARAIAQALASEGHEVWWDRHIAGGSEYSREIERQLETSDHVLVLWSGHSAASPWVRDEAAAGRDSGKLVPLSLDGAAPPLGFRQFQTIDLQDWLRVPGEPLPERLRESVHGGKPIRADDKEEQRIAFCRTPDGVTLAFSRTGAGPPLVKVANWINHLEYEWSNPLWRPWIDELSAAHTLLRYDERGNGMSDWDVDELTFDRFVEDLGTVVDAAGLEKFDLVAISQGSPVAVAYAARNPQRIGRMVLINGFAAGWRFARDPDFIDSWQAMSTLAKTGWGKNSPAFRQVFTSQFFPDATKEQAAWWNDLQKKSASAENAYRFMQLFGDINVTDLLPQVQVPTLVMHCKDDQLIPFDAGRMMAARIPHAEFVALDSRNHLPLPSEPAWGKIQRELHRFLG